MTIELREDLAYVLLDKLAQQEGSETDTLSLSAADLAGRRATLEDLLAHIDYLNQKGYVEADFSGDAYGDQGPNPLPEHIHLKAVTLTEPGHALLNRMREHPPESLQRGPTVPVTTENTPFLRKIMVKGSLEDIYDARDLSEVVFRTMRDLMTTEASDRVANDLNGVALPTDEKALQNDVSELWQDTNLLVRFLSRLRPPLEFDDELFLRRIAQEGGLPRSTNAATAIRAVFSATKESLSAERVQEIGNYLPGKIKTLWEQA
jgi:uncharacterized protein (DUF2267 family)